MCVRDIREVILLDPHSLSLCQNLPKYCIATFAFCHKYLPFLAMLDMVIFDIQTSCGGLKVSEFYQESDYGVQKII